MIAPRIVVVEDEAVIAMMLEMFLQELGCDVVEIAGNVQQAVQIVQDSDFDYAFLDINLNGQKAHVLPSLLTTRRKAFAFVTGYGEHGVLPAYAHAPIVSKPFNKAAISNALSLLREAAPTR